MSLPIVAEEAPPAPAILNSQLSSIQGAGLSLFISFVRIPALVIRQQLRPLPPLGLFDEDRISMHVWPQDIDLNLHMNNGRYLSAMDYARTHMLARTGLLTHVVRSRWQPLVGAVWITYRRSLPLFSSFEISSQLVCWDARWFYIEQTFFLREGLAAVGWVKGALRDRQGILDPQSVVDLVSPGVVSPPLPEAIAQWNELTRGKLHAGDPSIKS